MMMTKLPVANQPQLARPRPDLDVLLGVHFLQLGSDFLRAVRRAVVNDDELPVEVAKGVLVVL
jgi:hypothetical protein